MNGNQQLRAACPGVGCPLAGLFVLTAVGGEKGGKPVVRFQQLEQPVGGVPGHLLLVKADAGAAGVAAAVARVHCNDKPVVLLLHRGGHRLGLGLVAANFQQVQQLGPVEHQKRSPRQQQCRQQPGQLLQHAATALAAGVPVIAALLPHSAAAAVGPAGRQSLIDPGVRHGAGRPDIAPGRLTAAVCIPALAGGRGSTIHLLLLLGDSVPVF